MAKKHVILLLFFLILLSACSRSTQHSEETIPPGTGNREEAVSVPQTQSTEETVPTTQPETTPPEEQAEQPPAEPPSAHIDQGFRYMLGKEEMTYILSDRTWTTVGQLRNGRVLTIESSQPFGALYLEWNRTPEYFTLIWDGGSLECGENDFLHDYIRLPEAVTKAELHLGSALSAELAEMMLFTPGPAPEGIQDWQVPCDKADILVFPTHADDDVFFFGPMIAYYTIQHQLEVQTAFMVNHDLQPIRCHERLNGLWALGVRHYPIIGPAPDGGTGSLDYGLTYYRDSDIYSWQIEQIRRFQPLVILGHDLEGEYGSFAHKVNAYYLTQTVFDAANPEKAPASAEKYGTWDTPKVYLHLYPENGWLFDVNTPMDKDLQGRSPIQVADEALDLHVSQGGKILTVWQWEENPGWDCRPFGLFKTLVGYDSTADIMENIFPENYR